MTKGSLTLMTPYPACPFVNPVTPHPPGAGAPRAPPGRRHPARAGTRRLQFQSSISHATLWVAAARCSSCASGVDADRVPPGAGWCETAFSVRGFASMSDEARSPWRDGARSCQSCLPIRRSERMRITRTALGGSFRSVSPPRTVFRHDSLPRRGKPRMSGWLQQGDPARDGGRGAPPEPGRRPRPGHP